VESGNAVRITTILDTTTVLNLNLNLTKTFIYLIALMGSRGFVMVAIVGLVASTYLLVVIAAIIITFKFAISLYFVTI
jgi:hypothetical protein